MQREEQIKPFLVYRSSAGSGKTRSLSKEYLKLALGYRSDYFKHILAVTFTNKATQEMKDRILNYLIRFSNGEKESLADELKSELNLDDRTFVDRCRETLSLILHHYSHFSISTIDAFFQKVIRSFTKEAGLLGNFRLEVDTDLILGEVIGRLLDDLGKDKNLTEWVIEFSKNRLRGGSNWNVAGLLVGFAKEILKEDFKQLEDEIILKGNAVSVKEIYSALEKELEQYTEVLKGQATVAMNLLHKHNLDSNDFNYGKIGTAWKYFNDCARGMDCEPGARIRKSAADPNEWPSKKSPKKDILKTLAQEQLVPILNEMIRYYDSELPRVQSLRLTLKNFYLFGLISDIVSKLTGYKSENNIMLIADSSKFLNTIINNSDTPFIYEKVGSFYHHYLIDEFQDTSGLQWQNFKPLLQDGLDQNRRSLVVGDVKQSVYRWRGSDLTLLQKSVVDQIGTDRTQLIELRTNYRSAGNIVKFNNGLFERAAHRIKELTGSWLAKEAYEDVAQKTARLPDQGYVHFQFFEDWKKNRHDTALSSISGWVEKLQLNGASPGDIAILVRKNEEGQEVANYLMQYKESEHARKDCRYDVVSNDSLKLDSASCVSLLIAALRFVNNPQDVIALGEFAIAHSVFTGKQIEADKLLDKSIMTESPLFPKVVRGLSSLPIEEATEELIRLLEIGKDSTEYAYLQAFQDIVLEFSSHEKNDVASFLDWWEINKSKKSIQSSNQQGAINIITVHKAKGLQFKHVIIPFCDWSLNHDSGKFPLLWCKSDHLPFYDMGYLAIRYESGMKNSFFADDYQEEISKVFLDNLNLLYVAFTRAEDSLIVMAPANSPEGMPVDVGELVCESIHNHADLNKYFDPEAKIFQMGYLTMPSEKPPVTGRSEIILDGYPTADWRRKLIIRTQGSEFFNQDKSVKQVKINYGILAHQVLSRVKYKNDLEGAMQSLLAEGIIMEEEKNRLNDTLMEMMKHPVVSSWFSDEWTVKTEVPVLVPGGKSGRMDRVIFKEIEPGKKKAIIIDYKTGDKKEEDTEQVRAYSSWISQMGYVDVEAFLLYLSPLKVVPVLGK